MTELPKPQPPSSLEILKALVKRGKPKPEFNLDPRIGEFENLRSISSMTGEIYPQQVLVLKRGALLIGGSAVTLGIDRDNRLVTFTFEAPVSDSSKINKLQQLVWASLGSGWCAKMLDDDSGKVGPSRKNSKSKGTRGRKKTRKRRQ